MATTAISSDMNRTPDGITDSGLQLKFFGAFSVTDAAGLKVQIRGRKAQAIFAYLALTPGQILRETLANLLWSRVHREQGRASLRHSVYEIQSSLQNASGWVLKSEKHYLELNQVAIQSDVQDFLNSTPDQLEGLKLQTGALLENLYGVDPAFNEWIKSERQRVDLQGQGIAKDALIKSKIPANLIIAAEYLLQNDITSISAWKALMQSHSDLGHIEDVEVVYQRCKSALGDIADSLRYNKNYAALNLTERASVDLSLHKTTTEWTKTLNVKEAIRFAVLPFRILDHNNQSFANVLYEEIALALVQFRGISCLTHSSLQTGIYDTGIFRNLGINFAIGGRVHSINMKTIVAIYLIDVNNGGEIIWSRNFNVDSGIDSVVPADTAAQIVAQIDSKLSVRKTSKNDYSNISEYNSEELIRLAIPAMSILDRRKFNDAGSLLSMAIEKDSSSAAAHAWYAYWNLLSLGQGWSDDPTQTGALTDELVKRAVALDPGDARALALAGHVQAFTHRRLDEAMILHERALSINPNLPIAWLFSGLALTYAGYHNEAIRQISHAKRLSPLDPNGFFFDMGLTLAYSLSGDDMQAITHGRSAAEINPEFSSTFKAYLSALGFVGSLDAITRVRHRLLVLEPGFTVSTALKRSPLSRAEDRKKFADGLKRGGLLD